MRRKNIEQGRLFEHGKGLGTVTEKMIQERAGELALIKGRSRNNILESDLEEARRELTGQEGLQPLPTPAENLPEEERWKPVAESVGHAAPKVDPPDEQTYAEELVEEGVEEAEHDQMVRATRQAKKNDHR